MILFKILISALVLHMQTSIYSLKLPAIDGSTIDFSSFQNKKILIVNTAINSNSIAQYGELEKLYQKYKDNLVIVVCPSSSFTGETYSNEDIGEFIVHNYDAHYIIASKLFVNGVEISPLYQWLGNESQNGVLNTNVESDFQKYLISGSGGLVGFFGSSVNPMSEDLQEAIEAN
jgi:glutathione peroxidase